MTTPDDRHGPCDHELGSYPPGCCPWCELRQVQTALVKMTDLRDRAVAEGHRIGAYWAERIVELVDPLKHEVRRLEAELNQRTRAGR